MQWQLKFHGPPQLHTHEPYVVEYYDLFLLINVGVTETTPIRNRVAIDWKS